MYEHLDPLSEQGVQKKLKKEVKNSCYGRDLVITAKLAQFLTDRAQISTNPFTILPTRVSEQKK